MARKKTEAAEMPATQVELKTVRLALPVEDHRKLRRLAADHDTNMALLARKIVLDFIAKNSPRGATK